MRNLERSTNLIFNCINNLSRHNKKARLSPMGPGSKPDGLGPGRAFSRPSPIGLGRARALENVDLGGPGLLSWALNRAWAGRAFE